MKRICLALLAVCVLNSHAWAQGDSEAQYKMLVEEAVMEFGAGRYAEARALFSRAHSIKPNARTLRGLGMTAFELRNYTVALRMLQDSLSSRVNPLTPEQQQHAQGLIARCQVFVGTYKITMPQGATLKVDGNDAELSADKSLMLDTGKHTVVATFADSSREQRQVDVKGGEQSSLEFGAGKAAAAPAVVAAAEGEQAPAGQDPEPAAEEQPVEAEAAVDVGGSGELDIVPLALMGGGALLIVGAAITGSMALSAATALDDRCPEGEPCHPDLQEVKDRMDTTALVTDILWISGAVVGGIGAYLFFTADDESSDVALRATVAASDDGGGILLQGAF